jgi:hypothetical protein
MESIKIELINPNQKKQRRAVLLYIASLIFAFLSVFVLVFCIFAFEGIIFKALPYFLLFIIPPLILSIVCYFLCRKTVTKYIFSVSQQRLMVFCHNLPQKTYLKVEINLIDIENIIAASEVISKKSSKSTSKDLCKQEEYLTATDIFKQVQNSTGNDLSTAKDLYTQAKNLTGKDLFYPYSNSAGISKRPKRIIKAYFDPQKTFLIFTKNTTIAVQLPENIIKLMLRLKSDIPLTMSASVPPFASIK